MGQEKEQQEYDERGLFGSKSQAWWRLDFDRRNNQKNMMREDCLGQNLKPGGAWILTGETIRRI